MAKTASLNIRINPDIKEEAEDILASLGISASSALNMFYKQVIIQRGIPFDLKLPPTEIPNMSILSEKEIEEEIEKGYQDVKHGRTVSANSVFSKISEENDW